jgi:hypothetical protein
VSKENEEQNRLKADILNAALLREGEGFALIQKNASQLGKFEVQVEFNVNPVGEGAPGLTEEVTANNYPMAYVKKGRAAELRSKIVEP